LVTDDDAAARADESSLPALSEHPPSLSSNISFTTFFSHAPSDHKEFELKAPLGVET
jgi:hypothetical protein